MSISTAELHWTAGLMEGKGGFYIRKSTPSVHLALTDYSIVERVSKLWDTTLRGPQRRQGSKKDVWITAIYGSKAVGWMLTLYSILGERRRATIKEIIRSWVRCDAKPQKVM